MRPTVPVALLLVATLLAGCTGNDEGDSDQAGTDDSSRSPSTTETTTSESPEPAGALIDRPSYSFYLPFTWEDTTDDHGYVSNDDAFYGAESSSAINAGTMTIDHEIDVPFATLEQKARPILKSLSVAHPGITWDENTEFAGVPSLHAVMPGSDEGTTFQSFYMIRNGDSTQIDIQTRGGRKASQQMVDQIEASWTWK